MKKLLPLLLTLLLFSSSYAEIDSPSPPDRWAPNYNEQLKDYNEQLKDYNEQLKEFKLIEGSKRGVMNLLLFSALIWLFWRIVTHANTSAKLKRSRGEKFYFWLLFLLFFLPFLVPILVALPSGSGIYGHGKFFNINDLFELLVMNSPLIMINYFAYKAFKNRKIKTGEIIWKYYGRSLLAAFVFFVGCAIFFMIAMG